MGKIISYQGSMDKLVWHKSYNNLTADTEVIVPVSHEAIFIYQGEILGSFAAGRYVLNESSAFIKVFEQTQTINATVYYIKKEGSYNIKWAVNEPMRIDDPVLKLPVEFEAEGVTAIRIIDPRLCLIKLIENTEKVSLEEAKAFFRGQILDNIKEQFLLVLNKGGLSIVEACNKPVGVATELQFNMRYIFSDFGVGVESVKLKKFNLVSAYAPECGNKCACGMSVPANAKFCPECGAKL